MNVIAVSAPVGGAGRTTLTAELASLLAARGHAVLAVECDPRNSLGLHFGLRTPAARGLCRHIADASPSAWAAEGLRSDDGVLFVPWGSDGADTDRQSNDDAATRRLLDDPAWLRTLLDPLDLPNDAMVLIDSPPWPSLHARQALNAADLALVAAPPGPEVCATLPRMRQAIAEAGAEFAFVATHVHPARPLHADVLALLRATLGGAMLPYQVHADAGVPDALARGESFCRAMPHSQAAHDLQGIAAWLSHWAAQRAALPNGPGRRRGNP